MKLDLAIDEVQQGEVDLAKQLQLIGQRHATEHDVYHLGQTLAQQCAAHIERLRPFVDLYGAHPADSDAASTSGVVEKLRRAASEAVGRSDAPALQLLRDLRDTYLLAQRVELDWTILVQAAKAVRDGDLLGVATSCQEETEHTAAWLRTKIKEGAPQVLAGG